MTKKWSLLVCSVAGVVGVMLCKVSDELDSIYGCVYSGASVIRVLV